MEVESQTEGGKGLGRGLPEVLLRDCDHNKRVVQKY